MDFHDFRVGGANSFQRIGGGSNPKRRCVLKKGQVEGSLQHWCVRIVRNIIKVNNAWIKVFKNGPSKSCGIQPLKNLNSLSRP